MERNAGSVEKIDGASLSAMAAVLIGWFFSDTLVVSLGSLHHGVRFFDISAAIADPSRIVLGVDASLRRILFGLICVACLLAPLLPHWRRNRAAWAAYQAPLLLMILCGALLYLKTSGEFLTAPSDAGSLSGGVFRFANDLVHRGSGLVAKHITIGVGAYLAIAGGLVLAAQGIRQMRRHAA